MLTFNVVRASYSETSCDFFLGFFSIRAIQYQETHSTLNEKKKGWPNQQHKKTPDFQLVVLKKNFHG